MRDIPGQLSWARLALQVAEAMRASERATEHKPKDRREFAAACRDMVSRGYSTADVAHALNITVPGVLELLAEEPTREPPAIRRRNRGPR